MHMLPFIYLSCRSVRIATKSDPKNPGQVLSMGFGFVEFKKAKYAKEALKKLQSHKLKDHVLELKLSSKSAAAPSTEKQVSSIALKPDLLNHLNHVKMF